MRWSSVYACVLIAMTVGCGGSDGGDAAASRTLSADEQDYANEIAVAGEFESPAEGRCVGEGLVRAFGLKRAKQLNLANEDTSEMTQPDAEKAIGVLDGCVSLAEVIVREAQEDLDLSDAEVVRCAQLLDRAKVREMLIKTVVDKEADVSDSQQLQKELLAALPRCKD